MKTKQTGFKVKPVRKRDIANTAYPVKSVDQVPSRLGVGKGVIGPEFAGCCNSGSRTLMLKDYYLNANSYEKYKFVVGPEVYVHMAVMAHIRKDKGCVTQYNPYPNNPKNTLVVKFFKTYAAAKREFIKRMEARNKRNAEIIEEMQEKATKAKQGDLGAFISLGLDY